MKLVIVFYHFPLYTYIFCYCIVLKRILACVYNLLIASIMNGKDIFLLIGNFCITNETKDPTKTQAK